MNGALPALDNVNDFNVPTVLGDVNQKIFTSAGAAEHATHFDVGACMSCGKVVFTVWYPFMVLEVPFRMLYLRDSSDSGDYDMLQGGLE